jgi:hypothetical protein
MMATTLSGRVNTLLLALVLAVGIAIVALLATRSTAGPLDPPGPPASTLPQVEPRSPIPPAGWSGAFPITITQPGSYFLTQNLSPFTAGGIDIEASDVTLDLNGFTISRTGVCCGVNEDGIFGGATLRNAVTVRNGTIDGFATGIQGIAFVRSSFEDLKLAHNVGEGLDIGSGNLVLRVMAWANDGGIRITQQADNYGGSLTDCIVSRNTGDAVVLNANNVFIKGCVIDANTGDGLIVAGSFNNIEDSRITGNIGRGVALNANRNVLVRNNIDGNQGGSVVNVGAGNIVGPLEQGAGTNPSANLGFP